jgi:hypothetical protein
VSRTLPSAPHPTSIVVDASSRLTREWVKWVLEFVRNLQFNAPITGTVTFAAATTAAVTFTTALPDANYQVHVDAPEDRRVWVTSKATTGFTINVSASSSETYCWTVLRR